MKVAVLYSGGKDSTYAIDHAIKKGWEISYLLSVKPTRTDCYLFHFATVEHTKELAKILGIRQIYATCDIADPVKEAEIVKNIIIKNPVDAVLLGGVGLQETQLKSIQTALRPYTIEAFAAHAGMDEDQLLNAMIDDGYEIVITEIASDGLTSDWLGKTLTKDTLKELKALSLKFGFNVLGEGGYYNSLVIDGPIFKSRLVISGFEKVMDTKNSGYLIIKKAGTAPKIITKFI